ncbi:MAG: radical SAM protein [Verrucomicrobiales bacterium]|nr:radical SAM protein [Verrucomicrobiales bacterium]
MSEPSRYEPSAAARPDGVGSEAELDSAHDTLARVLDSRTVASTLCRREGERIRCLACAHRCLIGEGRRGICRVRFVKAGELRVPFGYVAGGLASDPVEKKPFFHVYPGSDALTFGMLGCNFHCPFCQNWVTSQALRESISGSPIIDLTPEQVVNAARRSGARLVVSSYNEPLISIEWAVAIFQKAKLQGLVCALVSNGYATPEVIEFIKPWVAAYKIDLKGFELTDITGCWVVRLKGSKPGSGLRTRTGCGSRSSRSLCPGSTTARPNYARLRSLLRQSAPIYRGM